MSNDTIKITRRHLPHWTTEDALYFVTFSAKGSELSDEEKLIVLNHIKEGKDKFYKLSCACVMNDHVHLILFPLKKYSLSRIMKGIKGVSSRKINLHRNGKNLFNWLDESYDRIIRDKKDFDEKVTYIYNNPVKEKLTDDTWKYIGWYYNEEF